MPIESPYFGGARILGGQRSRIVWHLRGSFFGRKGEKGKNGGEYSYSPNLGRLRKGAKEGRKGITQLDYSCC